MSSTAEATRTQRILVVDDDLETALLISLGLRRMGHNVLTADNAVDGLQWAQGNNPEVVLLDLEMDGLDGYQTCRLVRNTDWGANALIVAVTGHGNDDHRRRTLEAGFDHHLVKPVDCFTLDRLIRTNAK